MFRILSSTLNSTETNSLLLKKIFLFCFAWRKTSATLLERKMFFVSVTNLDAVKKSSQFDCESAKV